MYSNNVNNANNRIIEFYVNNGIIEFIENMEIENIAIVENPENNQIDEPIVLNLGPPPILQRNNPPVYFGFEEAEELIAEAEFPKFQGYDDFIMPIPCSICYWAQCNGTCAVDTPFIGATQLAFEEEMDLPPTPVLSRISAHPLLDEEWRLPPTPVLSRISAHSLLDEEWRLPSSIPPLTRCYTNSHLLEDEEQDNEEQDNEEQDNEEQENEEQDK